MNKLTQEYTAVIITFLETDYQCIGYQYIDNRLLLLLYDVFKLLKNTHRRNTQIEINYDSKFQSREMPPKNIFKFGKTFLSREISIKNPRAAQARIFLFAV